MMFALAIVFCEPQNCPQRQFDSQLRCFRKIIRLVIEKFSENSFKIKVGWLGCFSLGVKLLGKDKLETEGVKRKNPLPNPEM